MEAINTNILQNYDFQQQNHIQESVNPNTVIKPVIETDKSNADPQNQYQQSDFDKWVVEERQTLTARKKELDTERKDKETNPIKPEPNEIEEQKFSNAYNNTLMIPKKGTLIDMIV